MCDGLKAEMAALAKKGVKCAEVDEERWGSITRIRLPGGGKIGLVFLIVTAVSNFFFDASGTAS